MAIADIMMLFVQVFEDCQGAPPVVMDLIHKLSQALKDTTFIKGLIRLIKDPFRVVKLIIAIVSGFSSRDYYKSGDALGELAGKVIGVRTPSIEELVKQVSQ